MKRNYIILGGTPQALAILRELGRAGADVTVFCQATKNVAYHSRYGKKVLFHNVEQLQAALQQIIETGGQKPICYICSGEVLALVLRTFTELYDLCEVYPRPLSAVTQLAHKDQMYDIALQHHMDVAPYVTLDLYQPGQLQFPIILKRNYEIPLFFKVARVTDEHQLQTYLDRITPEQKPDIIAQEYVEIPPKNLREISCQGYYVDGKCCGMLIAYQKRKLKKGLTACIEEISDPDLVSRICNQVLPFMQQVGYTGFAEFEFMLDTSSRRLCFLEINTRTCGEQSAMHHKFSNITSVVLTPDQPVTLTPQIEHLRWINILRDIRVRIEQRKFGSPLDFFTSKCDILTHRDIKPFFAQIFGR